MKAFFYVLQFELNNYFKNKLYILSTVIISCALILILSIPSFVDISSIFSSDNKGSKIGIVDEKSLLPNVDYFKSQFSDNQLILVNNKEDLIDEIDNGDLKSGFEVKSLSEYEYYVQNKQIKDDNQQLFEIALSQYNKENLLKLNSIDVAKVEAIYNTPLQSNVTILGKDSSKNYFYTYVLIFLLYIIVILYGQLVATSITLEKSTRTIELLVSSTNSNSLIFGKVFSGAIASFVQFAIILSAGIFSYKLNSAAWDNKLDFIFNIPNNVLIMFAIFGTLGYIFYSFIYGMLGTLVSKTEDVSKTASTISMLYVVVFLLSMFNLENSDGILIRIMSFIPFSSSNAMITRVAMGTVSNSEIIIAIILLLLSIVVIGLISSKIYKKTILMYGNRIRVSTLFKLLKSN